MSMKESFNWREQVKNHIRHRIYKTMGTPSFIRRLEWRTMLEWLEPKEGERILDVACGSGELSLKIAERGCEVHGIDMSEDAISSAKRLAEREKIACEFVVGSAEDLSLEGVLLNRRNKHENTSR